MKVKLRGYRNGLALLVLLSLYNVFHVSVSGTSTCLHAGVTFAQTDVYGAKSHLHYTDSDLDHLYRNVNSGDVCTWFWKHQLCIPFISFWVHETFTRHTIHTALNLLTPQLLWASHALVYPHAPGTSVYFLIFFIVYLYRERARLRVTAPAWLGSFICIFHPWAGRKKSSKFTRVHHCESMNRITLKSKLLRVHSCQQLICHDYQPL